MATVEHSMNVSTSDSQDPRVELAGERTDMANFRTQLALDRTTLAWVRTSLTLATFGFGTVGFFRSIREHSPDAEALQLQRDAVRFGVTLVVLGIVSMVLSTVSHWRALRQLRQGQPPQLTQWPLTIFLSIAVAIAGLVGLSTVLRK